MHDYSSLLIFQKPIAFKIVTIAMSGKPKNEPMLGMISHVSGESSLVLNGSLCHYPFSLHTLLANLATFSDNTSANN